jgi:pimeloyl-ACP methyl ester carboxylesterase
MESKRVTFEGYGGITLVADVWGDEDATPVLFMHGGGQTRHAWGGAAARIAEAGWKTVSLDLRGHGESDWAPEGDYSMTAFSGDCRAVVAELSAKPVLVGASLGGFAAMRAEGAEPADLGIGLVLVDIAPGPSPKGVGRIRDFMESGINGFDSLDEAAAAIAAYTPQRKREVNYEGLKKVLRERDGRWYWHWDPEFMNPVRMVGEPGVEEARAQSLAILRNVHVPTMLVRGMLSDVVSEEGVELLREGIPDVQVVEVGGAAHMIAGDKNDQFSDAVIDFLTRSVRTGA